MNTKEVTMSEVRVPVTNKTRHVAREFYYTFRKQKSKYTLSSLIYFIGLAHNKLLAMLVNNNK
jgi:hypothetical protein